LFNVLDLFSGIGGFSLGLEKTFFKTVAFCEQDLDCIEILNKNWPKIPVFKDIRELNKEILKDLKIDIITGGFPCQDISFAGNRKGIIQGDRSSLSWESKKTPSFRTGMNLTINLKYL